MGWGQGGSERWPQLWVSSCPHTDRSDKLSTLVTVLVCLSYHLLPCIQANLDNKTFSWEAECWHHFRPVMTAALSQQAEHGQGLCHQGLVTGQPSEGVKTAALYKIYFITARPTLCPQQS